MKLLAIFLGLSCLCLQTTQEISSFTIELEVNSYPADLKYTINEEGAKILILMSKLDKSMNDILYYEVSFKNEDRKRIAQELAINANQELKKFC